MQETLFNYPNLEVKTGMVFDLLFDHNAPRDGSSAQKQWGKVTGVRFGELYYCEGNRLTEHVVAKDTGETISCSAVVICTGTFLGGEIHIGINTSPWPQRADFDMFTCRNEVLSCRKNG